MCELVLVRDEADIENDDNFSDLITEEITLEVGGKGLQHLPLLLLLRPLPLDPSCSPWTPAKKIAEHILILTFDVCAS